MYGYNTRTNKVKKFFVLIILDAELFAACKGRRLGMRARKSQVRIVVVMIMSRKVSGNVLKIQIHFPKHGIVLNAGKLLISKVLYSSCL